MRSTHSGYSGYSGDTDHMYFDDIYYWFGKGMRNITRWVDDIPAVADPKVPPPPLKLPESPYKRTDLRHR